MADGRRLAVCINRSGALVAGARQFKLGTDRSDMSPMHTSLRLRRVVGLIVLAAATTLLAPVAARASTAPKKFGISYGGQLVQLDAAAIDARLADAQVLGVTSIREQLDWSAVQYTSPTTYDWSAFDRVVAGARKHNLSVNAVLTFTPPWARPAGCTIELCAPADPTAFARFAGTAARRYSAQGVHIWEVWNEPNLAFFWQPASNATAYATLLRDTVTAIHGVDRTASIVSGGLSPAATVNGSIDPRSFVAATCNAGGYRGVAAVGFHPYSYPVLPTFIADWNAWQQMGSTGVSIRSILTSCGAGSLPIVATEYGAPTGGPSVVSDVNQAAMISSAVLLTKQTPWLSGLYVHTDKDLGTDPSTSENFFGLRRADGTAKPAYAALRDGIKTLP